MSQELKEFHEEFFQAVLREADAGGRFAEDTFFELFCQQLVDAGELETADRARYVSPRGIRIDGYGGDPAYADGVLSLIIADFQQDDDITTLTRTEMEAIFRRGTSFLSRALDRTFRDGLEETSPGFALADLIARSWNGVSRVRLFLISNRLLSSRVDGQAAGEVEGIPVGYSVWDLGRLHRFVVAGRSREDLVVDLAEHGGPVPVLPAHLASADYKAFLLVMPGSQLASIYDRWGARLLEQNVRVFLQAKGGVNKGIRNTLEQCPEMFFAYNNGITATAEEVATAPIDGVQNVTHLKNFQIVNGGQTTASIYAASRSRKSDLSRVFVQVKLSVIPPARAEEVVPKISEYANSQNKVNAADFFSNHPFHVRTKGFSERVFAPSRDGTFRESKWFYERARGQYQDARANLTVAERRKFDLEFPKKQVFTKTDLAKVLMVWRGLPHIVSRGSQKNFAEFARYVGTAWEESPDTFNEQFYRHLVAKTIAFNCLEKLVSSEPWYEGGYRANIVAYAIAKLAHDVETMGRVVEFDRIWRDQDLSAGLRGALLMVAERVKDVIIKPEGGYANVTEWAKQPLCWTRVQALRVAWPSELVTALVSREEEKSSSRAAVKEQRVLNGIEAQTAVVQAGGEFWRQLREWAVTNRVLSTRELDALGIAARMPQLLPTEKQCQAAMAALGRAQADGCPLTLESEMART
jgi:hypothetical protein